MAKETYQAASGTVRLVLRPALPSVAVPDGVPGEIIVNEQTYELAYIASLVDGRPVARGYQLTYVAEDGEVKVYHVDPAFWECTCADSTYRGRLCKHAGAVKKLIECGKLVEPNRP